MQSKIPNDGARCGAYVIGLFDLSGTSNDLAPYIDISSVSESNIDTVQREFKHIVTKLYHFRRSMQDFFDAASDATLRDAAPEGVPAEALSLAAEFDTVQIKLQGFSDTVVAYFPLATSPGKTSIYKIAALLFSVASTMLTMFARGSVVRGALDVTWAIEPFEGEIYGPALMSVYDLERKAGWPRVVLGAGVRSLWATHGGLAATTPRSGMNKLLAKLQSQLAFRDSDGKFAVDYLGPQMLSMIGETTPSGLIDAAQVGLETELAKRAGDATIESKLRSTITYFESRVGLLNDERRQRAAEFLKSQRPPEA